VGGAVQAAIESQRPPANKARMSPAHPVRR
jgi:hypothetical protein